MKLRFLIDVEVDPTAYAEHKGIPENEIAENIASDLELLNEPGADYLPSITDARLVEIAEPIAFVAPKGEPPQDAPSEPLTTVKVSTADIEKHRSSWAKVAKEHGWYKEPFPVQFWIYADGRIQDCVSFKDLKADLYILVEDDPDAEYAGEVREIRVLRPDELELV